MSVIDPRLLRYLATAKAAGLEVAGFEVGPRLIKIQTRGSVGAPPPDKFDTWLIEYKAKAKQN